MEKKRKAENQDDSYGVIESSNSPDKKYTYSTFYDEKGVYFYIRSGRQILYGIRYNKDTIFVTTGAHVVQLAVDRDVVLTSIPPDMKPKLDFQLRDTDVLLNIAVGKAVIISMLSKEFVNVMKIMQEKGKTSVEAGRAYQKMRSATERADKNAKKSKIK